LGKPWSSIIHSWIVRPRLMDAAHARQEKGRKGEGKKKKRRKKEGGRALSTRKEKREGERHRRPVGLEWSDLVRPLPITELGPPIGSGKKKKIRSQEEKGKKPNRNRVGPSSNLRPDLTFWRLTWLENETRGGRGETRKKGKEEGVETQVPHIYHFGSPACVFLEWHQSGKKGGRGRRGRKKRRKGGRNRLEYHTSISAQPRSRPS